MRAIAQYTCTEFLRKKILYVIVGIVLLLLVGSIIAGQLALSEQTKVIQDMSLGAIEICGLIMTLFFGSYLLADEISQWTIFLLLSKHINRASLLIGKYLWFAGVLLILRIILAAAFGGVTAFYHIPWEPIFLYALVGIFVSWLLTLAVVVFFSTFVSPFVALFAGLVIYLLGHMMSFVVYYVTVIKIHVFSPAFAIFIKAIYYIIPNYTLLSVSDFIGNPSVTQFLWTQFLMSVIMSIVTIVLLLTLGGVIFRKREL